MILKMALSSKGGKKKARKNYSDSEDDFEFGDEKVKNGDYDDDFEDEDGDGDGDSEDNDEDRSLGSEEEDGEYHNDGGNDDEMKELEKEYMDLRNKEEDILKNLKQNKDDDLRKGEAVKSQKVLWDKSLELRVLLQKAFSSSNRLPQGPVRSSFCTADEVDKAYADMVKSTKETLGSIFELQEALVEQNPSIAQSGEGNSLKSSHKRSLANDSSNTEYDEEWQKISEMHKRIASFRDKSVDKWQRKTQVTSGVAAMKSKLHAFNQNISEQVSSYMRDPSRMLKQMQQRRSAVSIFGVASENAESNMGGEEGDVEGDPELVDDSEFYQQLLKEFFETVDIASSESAFYAVKRLQTKKRKIVDRRASKSRKIRYHVHEKIVNFMTPQPMVLPDMAPKLFQNLFGTRT